MNNLTIVLLIKLKIHVVQYGTLLFQIANLSMFSKFNSGLSTLFSLFETPLMIFSLGIECTGTYMKSFGPPITVSISGSFAKNLDLLYSCCLVNARIAQSNA
eukprot:NODE_212_length_14557_cov_0.357103.p12 type:complete len:102 gc:universal NODE_212_length_14557_cov_0.357103:1849-2154(+)